MNKIKRVALKSYPLKRKEKLKMEKLSQEEFEKLLTLVEERQDLIRKESYSNENVAEEYHSLSMISIKLETQKKLSKQQSQKTFLSGFTSY